MKHFKVNDRIFFPVSKLIIQQEWKMSLIFQGRVQWTVVMWLIPFSWVFAEELMSALWFTTNIRFVYGQNEKEESKMSPERGRIQEFGVKKESIHLSPTLEFSLFLRGSNKQRAAPTK